MAKKRTYSEVQLLNPLAKPDWRRSRVLQIIKDKTHNHNGNAGDDYWTRRFLEFFKVWDKRDKKNPKPCREHLFRANPDLSVAFQFHQAGIDNPGILVPMHARLLANQAFEQIGVRVGMSPEAVEYYERIWFSVRDRLQQHDWIMSQIIVPSYQRSHEVVENGVVSFYNGIARPFVSAGIKLISYRGGPSVCDYLLEGNRMDGDKAPNSRDESERFIASHAQGTLIKRSAIAAEEVVLHADNITEMFNVFARILEIQKRSDTSGGGSNAHNRLIQSMHNVVESYASQWYSPSVDPQHLSETAPYRYDGENDELRSGELAALADGALIHGRETMPPREPKPLMSPDEIRDKLTGTSLMAFFPGGSQGEQGDAKQ